MRHHGPRRARLTFLAVLALAITLCSGVGAALAAAPTVSLVAPGASSYTTADVSGTVDPKDQATDYAFEYSTDQVNWSGFTYLGPLLPESGPQKVSTELTGLKPATQYWVRLNAQNFIDPEVISAEPNATFTTTALAVPAVSIDPISTFTTSTAHFSGTIDPEAPAGNPPASEVSWHFECNPECPGLEGTIAPDSAQHQISANATGLKPHTVYEVTLVATNAAGPVTAGPEHFTTAAIAPTVETVPAFTLLGGTKALVGGKVNPENSHTAYWFEYGLDASYGASTPTTHDADAGLGEAANLLTQEVSGLQPSTTYHFRILASNPAGTVTGLDQTFTTPSAEALGSSIAKLKLPDNRAWEQVSPPDKNGFDPWKENAVASASGDAMEYKSQGSFVDQPTSRGGMLSDYLSKREETGWSTHGITPPGGNFYAEGGYHGFTEELNMGFLQQYDPFYALLDPTAEAGENFYLRDTSTGTYKLLNGPHATGYVGYFAGGSSDFSHLVFSSAQKLTPDAPCVEEVHSGEGRTCLYEWVNGSLRLVSVLPGDIPANGSASVGQAISDDGTRIYFKNEGPEHLYVRTNGNATTRVDETDRTLPPNVAEALAVLVAEEAAHGEWAIFTSTRDLVNSDENSTNDIYLWDAAKPAGARLTLISQGNLPGVAAEVDRVVAQSKDLRRVYFTAEHQLLAGEPANSGQKLYLWEDNGGHPSLSYVANTDIGNARVSADGRYLAFTSNARLTAYDNVGQQEIYRYDASTAQLACASCDPEGRPATGSASFESGSEAENTFATAHVQRNVSSQGQVFFDSTEGLVPSDSNGQRDVYEYEDGLPHLLSSGVGGQGSQFLDASVSGNDIFFATSEKLVGWDIDTSFDVYDARVNGGFSEPPPGNLSCEGDSCQPASTPPTDATPASASFEGAGNLLTPISKPVVKRKAKPLTRAQKLTKALKACKKDKSKKKRSVCEKQAKRLYGRSK